MNDIGNISIRNAVEYVRTWGIASFPLREELAFHPVPELLSISNIMKKTLITLVALAGTVSATDSIMWSTDFSVTGAQSWEAVEAEELILLTSSNWQLVAESTTSGEWNTTSLPVKYQAGTSSASELRPDINVCDTGQGWKLSFTLNTAENVEAVTLTSLTFNTFLFNNSTNGYQTNAVNRDLIFSLAVDDQLYSTLNKNLIGSSSNASTNGTITFNFEEAIEITEATNFSFSVDTPSVVNGCYVGVVGVSANGALIPEPTTATLSLLALAGLAARRRRK